MGRIQLDVLFGEKGNFRREPIWFEVGDLNSPYRALLGHPALAKFMAIPHYAYLKMNLLGPRGVITITGCYKKSMECARASSNLAEALVVVEEKRQLLWRVALTQQDLPALSQPAAQFKLANVTKKILLDMNKPAKVAPLGPAFLLSRKASSPAPSVRIGTSSHGVQRKLEHKSPKTFLLRLKVCISNACQ
jgi:hypothetical protein